MAAPDEAALQDYAHRCRELGLPVVENREPDFNNELTAIAIGPERFGNILSDDKARKLFANLPLALRQEVTV